MSAKARSGVAVAVAVVIVIAIVMARWTDSRRELVAAANALPFRPIEGRLAETLDFRPYRAASAEESAGRTRTRAASGADRLAAARLLIAGRDAAALEILTSLLQDGSGATHLADAIARSTDPRLLIDFSAAALQRSTDDRYLVLAYEAADRAWTLTRSPSAAWNRAIAAERIGTHAFAARAWAEVAATERSSGWRGEAEERRRAAAARAAASPDASLELFFYRELMSRAMTGEPLEDVIRGDRLASDASAALRRLGVAERRRLNAAVTMYLRGRDAFDRSEFEEARRAYAFAEEELGALGVPLVLIARDQRIRSECSQGKRGCIETMRSFRREVTATGRYPWLAARSAYGEGQVLYRQGHIYEAAGHLQRALQEFESFGDATSACFMHVLLANAFAAGGESDLALRHFLDGVPCRTPAIVDRRRKMLEDAIMFMLRHGYIATAELLINDLAAASTTDASNVIEVMLRGVVAYRRGDARSASLHFARARALIHTVKDDASREDVRFRLAIAEAGSRIVPANPLISELDASIAAHERTEYSVWLPQLLTERGAAYERRNDLVRAENDYRRAMDILESREPRIDETVLALGIAAAGESPLDRAIRLLLRQNRIAGALSVAQRSNALRISSLHAKGTGVRDAFRGTRGGGDGIADLQSTLQPGHVAIAQHLLRDELITWVVTHDVIRATRQPVRKDELVGRAARLLECAARACTGEDVVMSLSVALLRPWIESVPRGATLLIQPPPELEAVAFSMLTTGRGERLVTRNAHATAPSFRAFARAAHTDAVRAGEVSAFFAAAPRPGGSLDPLPLAVREVNRASRSYRHATTETHATRAIFLERSPSFSIVHFAGHVVVHSERPLFSALVFEEGDLLYVHELDERSFTGARLVVLSACDTGRSPRPTMSVANALLSQNVPSVVYTHWPVEDEVAEAFSVAFHRAVAAGKARAASLRNAQLEVMQKWPHEPAAWAAFALAGASGAVTEAEKGEDAWGKRQVAERVTSRKSTN